MFRSSWRSPSSSTNSARIWLYCMICDCRSCCPTESPTLAGARCSGGTLMKRYVPARPLRYASSCRNVLSQTTSRVHGERKNTHDSVEIRRHLLPPERGPVCNLCRGCGEFSVRWTVDLPRIRILTVVFLKESPVSLIPIHHAVSVLSTGCGTTFAAYFAHCLTSSTRSTEKLWCSGNLKA